MNRKELTLPAAGEQLHVICWTPDEAPKAVVQIVHGMQEYIGRYEAFAGFLCENGIAVVGHDHPGHGQTAADHGRQLGFFADENGDELVLTCMGAVTQWIQETFPGVKTVILGHSMGSFFTRYYLTRAGHKFAGAVIMGTGHQSKFMIGVAQKLAGSVKKRKGGRYQSLSIAKTVNGSYNKKFEAEGENAWLSHNKENVAAYNKDPFCHYIFSCGAYADMFAVIRHLTYEEDMDRIPKDLPLLVVSGADDPVGDFGKGVTAAYMSLKKYVPGAKMILYPGLRHEILNEPDHDRVYADLLAFVENA